jgi:hypothetical protein
MDDRSLVAVILILGIGLMGAYYYKTVEQPQQWEQPSQKQQWQQWDEKPQSEPREIPPRYDEPNNRWQPEPQQPKNRWRPRGGSRPPGGSCPSV